VSDYRTESNVTEWITTAEAAVLTGYDATHVRYLVREGHIRGKKFGRDWMVHRGSLLAYAGEMKKLGTAKHDPWRSGARQRSEED
jgi:excisionase family DNA binding protein